MMKNLRIITIISLSIFFCGCRSSQIKSLSDGDITQQEINNSELYYQVLNEVYNYIKREKIDYFFSSGDTIFMHPVAEVQTWSPFMYQMDNMAYYYKFIDSIPKVEAFEWFTKGYFINRCVALKNPISLDRDPKKYNYVIKWSDRPITSYRYVNDAPWVFSPVIFLEKRKFKIYFGKLGGDYRTGRVIYFEYVNNKVKIKSYETDQGSDDWGAWHIDYISTLCDK